MLKSTVQVKVVFGEEASDEWVTATHGMLDQFEAEGKVVWDWRTSWQENTDGAPSGIRPFITREATEEWVAYIHELTKTIPRAIVSTEITDIPE